MTPEDRDCVRSPFSIQHLACLLATRFQELMVLWYHPSCCCWSVVGTPVGVELQERACLHCSLCPALCSVPIGCVPMA